MANSKQFPFRFFSAYEVLDELLHPKPAKPVRGGKGKPQSKPSRQPVDDTPPPKDLIDRYKNVWFYADERMQSNAGCG